MKKLFRILVIGILTAFSFYYTNKMIELTRSKDPIMMEIVSKANLYNAEPVNAEISGDFIIPGLSGLEVDVQKSYEKMKQLGKFNKNLLVFNLVRPKSSYKTNYDKYIISGNNKKANIAIVFSVTTSNYLSELLSILERNNLKLTFFVDGKWLVDNPEDAKLIINHDIENFGYLGNVTASDIKKTNNLIENLNNKKSNYCLDNGNNTIVTCSKESMYTIKGINTGYSVFKDIKDNLTNGVIYHLKINEYTINELEITLRFIKQKGYEIKTINDLLKE